MIITIKHQIIPGKRNIKEQLRVASINKHIATILWANGLTIKDVNFNGKDKWIVNQNIDSMPQKLEKYPTVSCELESRETIETRN